MNNNQLLLFAIQVNVANKDNHFLTMTVFDATFFKIFYDSKKRCIMNNNQLLLFAIQVIIANKDSYYYRMIVFDATF